MSSKKIKHSPPWVLHARNLRESWPGKPTQEGFARILGVSTSEVRRWEQGSRAPTAAQAVLLANHSGGTERLFWLKFAGLREDILLSTSPRRARAAKRRVSEETREVLVTAVDTILERAPSTVIEKVAEFLTEKAAKYGEPKE